MLDPRDRQLLLESLRPPDGYRLDCAVGTSFSLDLIALLTAPLAFTLLNWEDGEGRPASDPLALLESVRRHADRITLFCQAGAIKVPPPTQRLVAYLEQCVVESRAPGGGAFHPKIWVLRYTRPHEPIHYRLLCLTRNLTFDRCWDSVLSVDGELLDRRNAIASNHPVGDFIAALPGMVVRGLSRERGARIALVADEIRRVRFDLPPDVEDIAFWPMGIDAKKSFPLKSNGKALLVVSPFLSPEVLDSLTRGRNDCVLVSRADQLAQMPSDVLSGFQSVYAMDSAAEDEPEEGPEEAPGLSGLHAKLFIEEDGWNARVYTGSANATFAAFNRNVEFLVELIGKKSRLGIEAFLGQGSGKDAGFGRLLRPWNGERHQLGERDRIRESLESRLTLARDALSRAPMTMRCRAAPEDRFLIELVTRVAMPELQGTDLRCWPSSLRPEVSVIPAREPGVIATFGPLAFDAVTAFMAFELTATEADVRVSSRFASVLPLEGAPSDRLERLLAAQLRDGEQLLRFIWLLLQAEVTSVGEGDLDSLGFDLARAGRYGYEGYPIFERLVRDLTDNADRVRDVGRLIEDLARTPEGRALLPQGLNELWLALRQSLEEIDVGPKVA